LNFRVTAGQVTGCTECAAVLESVAVRRVDGGPRQRPEAVAGDKGYSTRAIQAWCRQHGVHAVIPEHRDQVAPRAHRRGRKPGFDAATYRTRSMVERVLGWLKRLRRAPRSSPSATPG
jgi:transposase